MIEEITEARIIQAWLGSSLPVGCVLRYDEADPYAITMTFMFPQCDDVAWTMARELVEAGLRGETADQGDVKIWLVGLENDLVRISLSSPEGFAVIEIDKAPIETFLARTREAVPDPGYSDQQMDACIAALLAEETR